MELGSMATTIGLEMVVPILLGYWIDRHLGTPAVFTIAGAGSAWQLGYGTSSG